MHRYGGLPAGLAALAVFALCRLSLPLPRRGDGGGGALAPVVAAGVGGDVRRRLAARRARPRRDLHRLSLGGERLRARRFAVRRLRALGRRLRARGDRRRGRRRRSASAGSASARAWLAPAAAAGGDAGARRRRRPHRLHPAGRRRSRCRCCRATCPQEEKFAARHVPQALASTAAQLESAARRPGDRPGDRHPAPARAARPGLVAGAARPLSPARPGRPHRPAARQRAAGLHQLGGRHLGRDRGAARRLLSLRQAPPGAVRRVHPDRLSLVHRDDEHPPRRLQPRPAEGALVRRRRPAGRAQHLLRGPVRRGAGGALRPRGGRRRRSSPTSATSAGSARPSPSPSTCRSRA